MTENEQDWAKAENAEVEEAKAAFADAQAADKLRQQITEYAANAVHYGRVSRDWVNAQLARLGAKPVTGVARYQINTPITGSYGTTVIAENRADALAKFNTYAAEVAHTGQVISNSYGQGVYNVQFTGEEPVFFSGPQDPPEATDGTELDLDGLRAAIRKMLMTGVTEEGWGYSYAVHATDSMDLEPLPNLHTKTVTVPVTGAAVISVPVFADADDDAVQRAAAAYMGRTAAVTVKPDEIGVAFTPRSNAGGMQMNLVDEGDDESSY